MLFYTWGPLLILLTLLMFAQVLGPVDLLLSLVLIPLAIDFAALCFGLATAFSQKQKNSYRSLYFPRWFLFLSLFILVFKGVWIYREAPSLSDIENGKIRDDLLRRRNYLLSEVLSPEFGPESSPSFMTPEFREEWAIGTLSMLGSALGHMANETPELKSSHVEYVGRLIERMLKQDIRIYEERYWQEDALESLSGDNGHIGYLGHLNLLLGTYRNLGGGTKYDDLHLAISEALSRRILSRPTRLLETFPGQIFIPDNAVVLASLSLFERSHPEKSYQEAIDAWITYAKTQLLDQQTGLLVPWVDNQGRPMGRPRGSYVSWNVFYLMQVDREFAREQARLIKKYFLSSLPFGACGIREYLPGLGGAGDVDSGPIVFGLSTSGTGFGLASARVLEDGEMMRCLLLTAETVGTSIKQGDKRWYLLAPLIGEAIVLAMRTA